MVTIKIDWMKRFANSPRIILEGIEVPTYPSEDDPIWQKLANGLHVARKGDFVFYFYTNGKPTEGFGGRRFAGTFKDGSKFEYIGAWSSRAGCVNAAYDEQIVDVTVGCIATAVTLEFLDRNWNFDLKASLVRRAKHGDIWYEPAHKGCFKGEPGFTYPE